MDSIKAEINELTQELLALYEATEVARNAEDYALCERYTDKSEDVFDRIVTLKSYL